jgi:hypothetical protein
MAAHYRATGEFLELEDPFGGMIRRGENGCRWKLWSIGPDGIDQGGVAQKDDLHDPILDIVLEMDR